ncbi:MAG: hypothetical protein DRP64_16910 [Verrucomicrobia bacterium]|nr:MAG: hypothetical protein DRP64_16910 [Verrucomicrobiota bacterium]
MKSPTFLTLIAAALLSFCLCFFNPLFIYFSDPGRIGTIPLSYVAQLIGISLAATAMLTLPMRKLDDRYTVVVCFLALAAFLYSYVVQVNFGLFRGNEFGDEAKIFATAKVAYFVEPLALIVIFFLLRAIIRAKKEILTAVLGFLLLSLGYELYSVARPYYQRISEERLAAEQMPELQPIFHFSPVEQNIVVLVLDAGAGHVVADLMTEGNRASRFDGFVHYRNTVSVGSYTMPSTAALIAGDRYLPDAINESNDQPIMKHIADAYRWLMRTLREHEFRTTFIEPKFVHGNHFKDVELYSRVRAYKPQLESRYDFHAPRVFDEGVVRYFSMFKAAPFSLKPVVYRSSGWKGALNGAKQRHNSIGKRYYEYLMLLGLSDLSDSSPEAGSRFNFLWNSTLIAPFNLNSECQPLEAERSAMYSQETRVNATRCCLDALANWLQWMKENGVYDNTKIILVSDHGAGDYGKNWYKRAVSALLMVKDFDEAGPFSSSDMLMQNSDVASMICSAIGGCEGIKDDPTRTPIPDRVAKYFSTTHGNDAFARENKQFEIKQSFEIRGSLFDVPEFEW